MDGQARAKRGTTYLTVFWLLSCVLVATVSAVAQTPLDDDLRSLKQRFSPDSILYRQPSWTPRSRQQPPGHNGWNVELVGLTGGAVYDVVVRGKYAYCATGSGLVIYDISAITVPRVVGQLVTPESAVVLAVSYPYAYVGCYPTGGLRVIDVSNPARPVDMGGVDFSGNSSKPRRITVSGNYAYVADGTSSVAVIDVSDARRPRLVASLTVPGVAIDVQVAGSYAYIPSSEGGLRIWNISNPLNPSETGFFSTVGISAHHVAVAGTVAYVTIGDAVYAVDVSNPRTPVQLGTYPVARVARVFVDGTFVYLARRVEGVLMLDASDPRTIRQVAMIQDSENDTWSVTASENHVFVADGYLGLRIVDVGNPSAPAEANRYLMPGSAYSIAVSGGYAFVGGLVAGLRVISTGDLTNPREIARKKTDDWMLAVAASGPYVYSAVWERGLQIFDVSDPLVPRLLGRGDTPGSAVDVAVSRNLACVADGYEGVCMFDVANPAVPRPIGSVDTPDQAFRVCITAPYAYVADTRGGLRIIDVSNPSMAVEVGVFDAAPSPVLSVSVSGSYAYLACGSDGLKVLDVSDPAHPRQVGGHPAIGKFGSVAAAGNLLYVVDYDEGLRVFDVTDPQNPVEVGYYNTPSLALDVAVVGNVVYLANFDAGVFILRYTGTTGNHAPRTPTLLAPEDGAVVSTAAPAFRMKTEDVDGDRVRFEIQATKGSVVRTFTTDWVASGQELTYPVPAGQELTAGQWAWKARAMDEHGFFSRWSETRLLHVAVNTRPAPPVLVAPGNGGSVSPTPGLTVRVSDPDADRVKAEIEVSNGSESRSFATDYVDSGTETVYVIPVEQLLTEGSWYWKARAIDDKGAQSEWSETWTFTVVLDKTPSRPTLFAPADGATVTTTPTFRIRSEDPNGDRVKYEIRLNQGTNTRTLTSGFLNSSVDATITVPPGEPLTQGQWTWKAKAIDEHGSESEWSEVRAFEVRVNKPDLVPSSLTLSSSRVLAGGDVRVTLQVTNCGDAMSPSSTTRLLLSRSSVSPAPNDLVLAEFRTPTLGVNDSITHSQTVFIPATTQPGQYFIWATANATGEAEQSNTENDRVSIPLLVVRSAQVWLPRGVSIFGVSSAVEYLVAQSLMQKGALVKYWSAAGYRDVQEQEALQKGLAYWVRLFEATTIRVPAESAFDPVAIPLRRGWNLIACPYPSAVQWRLDMLKVRADGQILSLAQAHSVWVEGYVWGWQQDTRNPNSGRYVFIYDENVVPGIRNQMEPWKGYWLYAHRDCELIVPPTVQSESRSTSQAQLSGAWSLVIQAQRGEEIAEAVIGVTRGGRSMRVGMPPEPPAAMTSRPLHVSIEQAGVPLAVDVRETRGIKQVWTLVVRFEANGEPVTLRWDGASRLPRGLSLTLVDETTRARRLLRTSAEYRLTPAPGETQRRFTLVAERDTDVPLRVMELRASATRGGATTIQFALSRPAIVRVDVLNSNGRRVAVLDGGTGRLAGQNTLIWRAVDMEGRAVPAGAYLVQVVAFDEEGRLTRASAPLVLVR